MKQSEEIFYEAKVKGDHGEDIIKFLINSFTNWECIPFGVENHVGELKNKIRENYNPTAVQIKKMPDFIVLNKETKEIFPLEVKWRSSNDGNYIFNYLEVETYKEHWERTKLIFVIPYKPYFRCIELKDINNSMKKEILVKGDHKYLWNFRNIEKNINDLFPELTDENILKAIQMIK